MAAGPAAFAMVAYPSDNDSMNGGATYFGGNGNIEESVITQKSYVDSLYYQSSQPLDGDENPYLQILPKPKFIHDTLLELGYYDNDNKEKGYIGDDFIGYKNVVIHMQNRTCYDIINQVKLQLFPIDIDYIHHSNHMDPIIHIAIDPHQPAHADSIINITPECNQKKSKHNI